LGKRIHAWSWQCGPHGPAYLQEPLATHEGARALSDHILVAYCGVVHDSLSVNAKWLNQFKMGQTRSQWIDIIQSARQFASALKEMDMAGAVSAMNREMAIRSRMTPDVLDPVGEKLISAAVQSDCGAKICGAGGGGCVWALGRAEAIGNLRSDWEQILAPIAQGRILDAGISPTGVRMGVE